MSWPFSPRSSSCWRTDRFAEISVDDLAKGAGISRPTFYFYFPSKDAVLLTLFERVIAEADATFEGRAEDYAVEPARAWRDGIYAFFEPLRAHVGVALAGVAATATNAEIRALWSTYMQKWIDRTAAVITAERARGAAPDTVPAQDLAAAAESDERADDVRLVHSSETGHCRRQLRSTLWCTSGSPASTANPANSSDPDANICSCPGRVSIRRLGRRPSCTLTSTPSTRLSSSEMTPRYGAGQ